MMINTNEYREDARGHLVPIESIREEDLLRDETVKGLIDKAKQLQSRMVDVKADILSDFNAYVDLIFEKYEVTVGGKKGNVTLHSYDAKYRVVIAINENIRLDERIHAAKALIDECIVDWSVGANKNLATLVNTAFKVDSQGNLTNIRNILQLRNHKIEDERWQRAMQAISDSIIVYDTKEYIRFYERQDDGSYVQISLDFAAI